jgi:CRP-like cAMP-binding protein
VGVVSHARSLKQLDRDGDEESFEVHLQRLIEMHRRDIAQATHDIRQQRDQLIAENDRLSMILRSRNQLEVTKGQTRSWPIREAFDPSSSRPTEALPGDRLSGVGHCANGDGGSRSSGITVRSTKSTKSTSVYSSFFHLEKVTKVDSFSDKTEADEEPTSPSLRCAAADGDDDANFRKLVEQATHSSGLGVLREDSISTAGDIMRPQLSHKTFLQDDMRVSGAHLWKYVSHYPVINPMWSGMAMWRSVMLVAVVFAVVMAPFSIAFHWWKAPLPYYIFERTLDVFFILDIILNFNVAYIDHGHLVKNRRAIAVHYAKTYLALDVLSNFPYDWVFEATGKKARKYAKIVKLAKLPKILRFLKLLRLIKHQTQFIGVASIVFLIVILAHYYTCIWVWLFQGDCGDDGMAACPPVSNTYLEGLSISAAAVSGSDSWIRLLNSEYKSWVSSGRQYGFKPFEDFVTTSMILSGLFMVATLFQSVAFAFSRMNHVGQARFAKLASAKEEMKIARIPLELQEKVEATFEHLWRFGGEKDSLLRDESLSLDLRRNLAFHMYGPTIRSVAGFENIDNHSLKCLAQKISLRLYSPGDLLVVYGEVGNELFIIQLGSVQPLDELGLPYEGVILGEGSFFGEACFLHPGTRRTASIRCFEFCRTLVLRLQDFDELMLSDQLAAIARESVRRMTVNEARRDSQASMCSGDSVPFSVTGMDPSLPPPAVAKASYHSEETCSHSSDGSKTALGSGQRPGQSVKEARKSARISDISHTSIESAGVAMSFSPVGSTNPKTPATPQSQQQSSHFCQFDPDVDQTIHLDQGLEPPGSCGDGIPA